MKNGKDPQNCIRDPEQNHALETSCGNTVMTPEQFEEMKHLVPARPGDAARAALEPAS